VCVTCFYKESSRPPTAVVFYCLLGGCFAAEPVQLTGSSPPSTRVSEKRLHVRGVVLSRIMSLPAHSGPRCELFGFSWEQVFEATRPKCTRPWRDPVVLLFSAHVRAKSWGTGSCRRVTRAGDGLSPCFTRRSVDTTIHKILEFLSGAHGCCDCAVAGLQTTGTDGAAAGAPLRVDSEGRSWDATPESPGRTLSNWDEATFLGLEGDLWRHRRMVL